MKMLLLLTVFINSFALSSAICGCKNPQGQDVDWWVAYKMPSISTNANGPISQGYGHYYMDASTNGWQGPSTVPLTQADSHAIAETLKQLYVMQNDGKEGFIGMYNDEWPTGETNSNYGHTIGTLILSIHHDKLNNSRN